MITKEELINLVGHFTFSFHYRFFIETNKGNFEWHDPNYPGGDNTIRPFNGTYKEWCQKINIPFGRDKGQHFVKDYCGTDFVLVQE